jgi:hypothetical protein
MRVFLKIITPNLYPYDKILTYLDHGLEPARSIKNLVKMITGYIFIGIIILEKPWSSSDSIKHGLWSEDMQAFITSPFMVVRVSIRYLQLKPKDMLSPL